jgi:hypothetical protein
MIESGGKKILLTAEEPIVESRKLSDATFCHKSQNRSFANCRSNRASTNAASAKVRLFEKI